MKKWISVLLAAWLMLGTAGGIAVSAAPVGDACELFVSPEGSDDAEGSLADPLKTIGAAQEKLKAMKGAVSSAKVLLRGGVYTLSEPLRFTGDDLPDTTYAAYENEEVVLSAAAPLSGFKEDAINGVTVFSVHTDRRFNALYHPDRAIRTPRLPEEGNFTVKSVDHADDLFTGETTYWDASRGNTSFNADPEEVGIDFSQPTSVWCRVTHAWLDEIAPIRFYDAASGKVGLGRPATYAVSPGDVYWFENVFEALDAPGEWYLDETTGTLYYVPFEGETAADLTLYAPASPYLLEIDGCNGLSFENIRFFGSEWTLSVPPHDGGVRDQYNIDAYQASAECDAAVNVQNADGIRFVNCEFTDIGNTALRFIKNCHDCTVKNSIFRRIGSTAIAVYGENVAPEAENAAEAMSGFHILNNLVEAWGRNTYESTGVHLMYVKDSEVRHNEIHDGYYTGLSCGWIWGHDYQVTENIQITDNLIYDIGQGWLSDLGGMYLLGEQKGTLIARNVIYNVTRGHGVNDYGGNGIYTDAGSSFFTIEQNLIYDCAANGLNLGGYNLGHTVRNNVVAYCRLAAFDPGWGDGLATDHTCDCTGNIFYADDAPVILDVEKGADYTESGNLLWDETNGANVFGSDGYSGNYAKKTKIAAPFAKWNGFFRDDLIADPLFTDPANRDFTLRDESPVFGGIAFTPVDFSGAGLPLDEAIGCGSEYERGSAARVSNLSSYEKACASPLFPYAFSVFGNRLAPILTVVLLAAAFLFNLLTARRKKDRPFVRRLLFVLGPAVTAGLLYPLFLTFVTEWKPVPYVISAVCFLLAAAVTPWCTVKRLPARIGLILPQSALFFAVTVLLNNVLKLGEPFAMHCAECLTAAFCFFWSARGFLKEKNSGDP